MDYSETLKTLLEEVRSKRISVRSAFSRLKNLPYANMGSLKIDTHRHLRQGFPEVIYAEGKTAGQVREAARVILESSGSLLITRGNSSLYEKIKKLDSRIKYSAPSGTVYLARPGLKRNKKTVPILTAGTSDLPVADEARVTLEVMGNPAEITPDVGVAGIHRLIDYREKIDEAGVIIVVAGMDGVLASVVGGLVSSPVIAVPTSVGYGASFRGLASLLTMLNSCAPGVVCVNIDNGFGAGYFAGLVNGRESEAYN